MVTKNLPSVEWESKGYEVDVTGEVKIGKLRGYSLFVVLESEKCECGRKWRTFLTYYEFYSNVQIVWVNLFLFYEELFMKYILQ